MQNAILNIRKLDESRLFIKYIPFLLISLCSFCQSLSAQSKNDYGWTGTPGNFSLLIEGQSVVHKETDFNSFPEGLNSAQRSEFAILAGEYLLLNKDTGKFSNLMSIIRKDKELSFAEVILQYFEDIYFSKKGKGEAGLKSWTAPANDVYQADLIKSTRNVLLYKKPSEKVKCSVKKPYYSLCRMLRLGGYLADMKPGDSSHEREYTNLQRILSPFPGVSDPEEKELKHLPFLSHFLPGISDYLAELGFARDAIQFSKIGIVSENLGGRLVPYSYEKLAYYYLIDGDANAAEKVLKYIIDRQGEITTSYKNSLYLKLGTLAYLQGDASRALDYYLNLDFLHWSARILHPLLGESISINSARDLVSIAVWRSKNSHKAVDALQSVSTPKNLSEDDLSTRLRIIQILSEDEPEVAAKLAMDLSFLAQSKGWRRVEYSATLLHGFLQLKTNNLRKAIIEFTKAAGILKEDPSYREEWIRLSGLFLSHKESTNLRGVKSFLDQAIRISAAGYPDDKVYEIKNYLPPSFGTKNLENVAIDFYSRHGYNQDLLSFLVHNEENLELQEEDSPIELGIVRSHIRSLKYKGFYPPGREPWTSSWSEIRAKEAARIREELDPISNVNFKKISQPLIALFVKDKRVFLFQKDGDSAELEFKELNTDNATSYTAQFAIKSAMDSFSKKDKVQIYLNSSGVEAADYLKKEFPESEIKLFRRFDKREEADVAKKIYAPSCENLFPKNSPEGEGRLSWQSIPLQYYDGVKVLQARSSLLLWNIKVSAKSPNGLRDYEWSCGPDSFAFRKMKRRLDFRNLPDRIVFTKDSLSGSGWGDKSEDFLDWARFWLSTGTSRLYYVKSWNSDSESDINLLERLSTENGDPNLNSRVLKMVRNAE
ncbi:tetratricopeptide repeat protein [Leptospira semungkisensis]|uniref:Tetratricopeptide repeat protein n=1 Tax=Leptospira semungkisensis TaxID=2484985 RepID=A0A4R9G5Q0_9LEPT|nr:tetratricopeptide repeat protein [Leptospira semungkisensis]TGK06896.1 tetratricopeptide repeat protein [Leptospira semungkisensis]